MYTIVQYIDKCIYMYIKIDKCTFKHVCLFSRSQFERIITHLIQLLNLTSSYPLSHPQTITTLRSLIVSAKHKLDLIKTITKGSSSPSLSHHVLYQLLESPVLYHPSPSRLSSVPSSMTNSRNSMPPLAAVGRLHPLTEPLVASNKSIVSSRFSAGTQSHTKPSGLSSAKSLMPTVPSLGTGCRVQCGPEVSFSYGFEYYGSDTSVVLSPSLEKSVVGMMRSLVSAGGCNGLLVSEGCRGKSNGSNLESARDVAKVRIFFLLYTIIMYMYMYYDFFVLFSGSYIHFL